MSDGLLVRGFSSSRCRFVQVTGDNLEILPNCQIHRCAKFNKTHGFTQFYLVDSLTGFLIGGNSDGGW